MNAFFLYHRSMMKIVAIGGGSIGMPNTKPETTIIAEAIVRLSGKKHPRVLFIPTASEDAPSYIAAFRKQYGERLGCTIETLLLYTDRPSVPEIAARIARADIIYVGGGNTLRMMKLWRKLGVDRLLIQAAKRGTVCSGLSAGSICWFREGNSDSLKYSNPAADYIRVRTLGLIDCLHCPHYDTESDRPASLKKMMKKIKGPALALDNCAALMLEGDTFRILTSKKSAKARLIRWKDGQYKETMLKPGVSLNSAMLRA